MKESLRLRFLSAAPLGASALKAISFSRKACASKQSEKKRVIKLGKIMTDKLLVDYGDVNMYLYYSSFRIEIELNYTEAGIKLLDSDMKDSRPSNFTLDIENVRQLRDLLDEFLKGVENDKPNR